MIRSLEFTLKVSNCLGCSFCPQDKLNGAYKDSVTTMTLETFRSIINRLPQGIRVDFSGYAEPFLNQWACEMIAMAIAKGFQVHVYSTLMGMKPGCVDVLKHYKPAVWRTHVPDKKALRIPDDKWIAQYELFKLAGIKSSFMAMDHLTDAVSAHLVRDGVTVELPEMLSRGGNLNNILIRKKTGPIRCAADRWHQNVVLPNGDVYICCMDYALTMPCGNLLRDSYDTIDTAANTYSHNMNPSPSSICRSCEWSAPVDVSNAR